MSVRLLAGLAAFLPLACGRPEAGPGDGAPPPVAYVGATTCAECHPVEHAGWTGSDHDLAMQPASAETVLGDFDGARFESDGVASRFRRRGSGFFVETEGPGGTRQEFEVAYVFGVRPLQQLLLIFPGGRLQCFDIAWDTVRGRWFDLYPGERFAPDDPLHWSGRYQRWNAMCAECHSTNLHKGYDAATDSYRTTWSELDVACEACHGPGGDHVRWARKGEGGQDGLENLGLTTALRRGDRDAQLDACAPCHSRRTPIDPAPRPGAPFLEGYLPELLHAGLYHPDGQIQDEVYVFGSFAQSKMHARGVACTDCHDPHSLRPWHEGDALCLQCHSESAPTDRFPTLTAKRYDVREHHHHDPDSTGARCVACHMPERTYMVIDPRRDHSLRIPRPDLSVRLGTPNACNDCHADRDAAWAAAAVERWYGERPARPSPAPAFAAARRGDGAALPELLGLVRDGEQSAIVRATALDLLADTGDTGRVAAHTGIADPDGLVRATAARAAAHLPPPERLTLLGPLLGDTLRAVRIAAARGLATLPAAALPPELAAPLERAFAEWRESQALSADMPWSHLNLAVVHEERGETDAAIAAYRHALEQDPVFLPARFNLATLLNRLGRDDEALAILRAGLEHAPEEGELHYSLGLLLAETGASAEAADALARAAELLPGRGRVQYNAGLALQAAGRLREAERALHAAVGLEPRDAEAWHALVLVQLELGLRPDARESLQRLRALVPDAPWVSALEQRVEDEQP